MKKGDKTNRILEFAYAAACGLFNYGGVILAALIEACVLTLTIYNMAMAEKVNGPLVVAELLMNALTAALLIQSIREVLKATRNN